MVTTIQLNENTLDLLRKLKEEVRAKSYEEAIKKVIMERINRESMAGYLNKYYKKKKLKDVLKELQDERRKSNRF